MRRWIEGAVVLLAAFFVYSLLRPFPFSARIVLDVFTVAVLLFGTVRGELPGAILGAASGLVVDAFSLGVFGLAGITLTAGGFLAGSVSRKINILPWPRTLVFFALSATSVLGLGIVLGAAVAREAIPWSGGLIALRPAATAVAATLLHELHRRMQARYAR